MFSGPDIPFKMFAKFFFINIPGYIILVFLKLNSAIIVFQEFCHSGVLSVQKTATFSKSLLQTF